jgi:hypothetical protein
VGIGQQYLEVLVNASETKPRSSFYKGHLLLTFLGPGDCAPEITSCQYSREGYNLAVAGVVSRKYDSLLSTPDPRI